jgi:hypothetical protein
LLGREFVFLVSDIYFLVVFLLSVLILVLVQSLLLLFLFLGLGLSFSLHLFLVLVFELPVEFLHYLCVLEHVHAVLE